MCAEVIAGCDASPVLDASKDVFDFVTLAIENLVVVILDFAV